MLYFPGERQKPEHIKNNGNINELHSTTKNPIEENSWLKTTAIIAKAFAQSNHNNLFLSYH